MVLSVKQRQALRDGLGDQGKALTEMLNTTVASAEDLETRVTTLESGGGGGTSWTQRIGTVNVEDVAVNEELAAVNGTTTRVRLPAAPNVGDRVRVFPIGFTKGTLGVESNGNLITGIDRTGDESVGTFYIVFDGLEFVFIGGSVGWAVIGDN